MNSCWIDEKRDIFVKNAVKDFLDSYSFFMDIREHTARYGVRYDGFDIWVGTERDKGKLWQLKDLCHMLWGYSDPAEDEVAFMLDWMVGAIFHEAMKLKENAYMIERYRRSCPVAGRAVLKLNANGDSPGIEFFEETEHEIRRALKRMALLFDHAEKYLIKVLKEESGKALLVRYLLEAAVSPEEHWPRDSGPGKLLAALFPNGLHHAYCLAGESYMEGSWFAEARKSFETALKLDPDCSEAKDGLQMLETRVSEITTALKKEYEMQTQNGNASSETKLEPWIDTEKSKKISLTSG